MRHDHGAARSRFLSLAAGAALAFAAIEAEAATLTATGAAAHSGNYGLRVEVGTSCSAPAEVTIDGQTLSTGETDACATLTASHTTIPEGVDHTFRSGQTIVLSDGFVVAGAFQAIIDPSFGTTAYVQSSQPQGEKHYVARFYLLPDALDLPTSPELEHLVGYGSPGVAHFRLDLLGDGGSGTELRIAARNDNGSYDSGPAVAFPEDGSFHAVEVDWRAATAPGSNDGAFTLSIDGVSEVTLPNLDNDGAAIDFVRWGAVASDPAQSGTMSLDDFDSRRSGPIGLLP